MADELEIARGDLAMSLKWVENAPTGDVRDRTLARFSMRLKNGFATAYRSDKGDVGDKVELPAYGIAEWLVRNWWALLFEPRKSDSDEDDGFTSRHWLGSARSGFALPDLWIVPTGDHIEFSAKESYLRFSRLTFSETSPCEIPRADVRNVFAGFVSAVVERLGHRGDNAPRTQLQELWTEILDTNSEQEFYCTLLGSLGLSPYDDNGDVDKILDELSDALPQHMLLDLCQASDERSLRRVAAIASGAFKGLEAAQHFDLSKLQASTRPLPILNDQPWRTGVDATARLRQQLGIAANDPAGGDALFDLLGLDYSTTPGDAPNDQSDFSRVSGALDPHHHENVRLALVEGRESQRKFTAARGIFLAMYDQGDSPARLITGARTKDQQASRAFAAELLAPIGYIRSRAGGHALSMYRVDEIADDLKVSPTVVKYQAQNNRIHVYEAY